MPRIFHVTFTREFDATIAADSLEELEEALNSQRREFDDWTDSSDWDFNISDPYQGIKNADQIPRSFKEPDMGVVDGECQSIVDYEAEHPDYMDKVVATANELAVSINLAKLQGKLFPED
jgi:hypothetical protein